MAKIIWSKALADYLKDETSSYASIARKYGVSLQAVKKRAGKEGWVDLRQKSIQKVNQELPKKIGDKIAEANARQAQIGKWLQWQGIKAIANKHLEPGNFTQAKDSIKEGVRIEREVLKDEDQQEKAKPFFAREEFKKYSWDDDSEKKPQLSVFPPVQKPVQIAPNTPTVDPQLLAKIQEGLSQISERLDEVKRKREARKTENTSANGRLTGWF